MPKRLPFCLLFLLLIKCTNKSDPKIEAKKMVTTWCELQKKIRESAGDERNKAKQELKNFEYKMDRKYHRTDPVSREAQDLMDKGCEEILKEKKL